MAEDCISVITLQVCNCAITYFLHLPRSAGLSLQLSLPWWSSPGGERDMLHPSHCFHATTGEL